MAQFEIMPPLLPTTFNCKIREQSQLRSLYSLSISFYIAA